MAGVSAAFGNMEEEKGRVKRQLPQRPKKSDRKALSTSSLIKNDEKIKKHSSASVIEAGERLSLSPPGTKPRTFLGYTAPSDISSNDGGGEDSSVVVAVRVRPFSEREMKLGAKQVVRMHNNDTTITSKDNTSHRFCYDHCFWSFDEKQASFADQTRVYRELAQPLLDWAFQGYNTCLFAYGQTGSGKSYCIMGEPAEIGIVPQFARELYDRVEGTIDAETSYKVEVSYYEIYKEKIYDLLASSNQKNRITVKWQYHDGSNNDNICM
jgi:kinesin family protein 14